MKNRRPSCPCFSSMHSALQLFAFSHSPSSVHVTYPNDGLQSLPMKKILTKQTMVKYKHINPWREHSLLSKCSVGQHPAQSSLEEVQQAWCIWQDCLSGLHICQGKAQINLRNLLTAPEINYVFQFSAVLQNPQMHFTNRNLQNS